MFESAKEKIDSLHWEVFTGTIVADQVWSETRVRGGGGGISINGIGVGSSRTSSTVTNKREFALQRADGLQEIFQFNADAVKVAQGQALSVIRVAKKKGKSFDNVVLINHSMQKTLDLAGAYTVFPLYAFLALGSIPMSIIGLFTLPLGIPLLAGNLIFLRSRKLSKEFKEKGTALTKEAEENFNKLPKLQDQSEAA